MNYFNYIYNLTRIIDYIDKKIKYMDLKEKIPYSKKIINYFILLVLSFFSFTVEAQTEQSNDIDKLNSFISEFGGIPIKTTIDNYKEYNKDSTNYNFRKLGFPKYNFKKIIQVEITQDEDSIYFHIKNTSKQNLFLFSKYITDSNLLQSCIEYKKKVNTLKINLLPLVPHPQIYGCRTIQHAFYHFYPDDTFDFVISKKYIDIYDKEIDAIKLYFALYDLDTLQIFNYQEQNKTFMALFAEDMMFKVYIKEDFKLE